MARKVVAAGPVEGGWALPDGWRWERLGAVAHVIAGQSPPSSLVNKNGEGLPFFQGKAEFGAERPVARNWCPLPTKIAESNDVLISVRAPVGPTNYAPERCGIGRGLAAIRAHALSPRFVRYWLLATAHLLREKATGTTFEAITGNVLRDHAIPVPPPGKDDAIAARVDTLFAEMDDGEAALARARHDLATWRKALLKAAVTGELTADWRAANSPTDTGADLLARVLAERQARWAGEPRNRGKRYVPPVSPTDYPGKLPAGWATASMPQLGDFGRGKSKHRPRNDPRLYGGPYPFVQTGVVSASRGKITRHEQTYTALGLAQSKLWPAETLCITIAANIAKTGVLQFDACFPDSVVGLSCADGVLPAYVELVIRTLQQDLEDDAPATAQKNINLETLETLPIPLPPSCEQAAIVGAFEEAEVAGDLFMRDDVDVAAATLRQSILAAAFRGDLA